MPPRYRVAAPIACWVLCAYIGQVVSAPDKKKKKDEDRQGTRLPHHSFATPLEYTSLLDDWTVSGASIFERDRLLLHAGVAERAAFVWNKMPLLTNNFEVFFQFKVLGEEKPAQVMSDQSFGFWYAMEDLSTEYNESKVLAAPNWKQGLDDQGMTLGGMKSMFEGLGVVLSTTDANKKPNPVVSGITNDGHTLLSWEHDLPTKDAKAVGFRNTMNNAQLKIQVKANSIIGWLKQSPSLSWNECLNLDRSKFPIKPGGYIGFTAWSGTKVEGATADLVQVTQLDVYNLDESTMGEDMTETLDGKKAEYREIMSEKNDGFVDQKAQSDHLFKLANMLEEFADKAKPEEENLYDQLLKYEARIDLLGSACQTEVQEVKLLMGTPEKAPVDHKAGVAAMTTEIIGLKRLLVKDGTTHRQKLDAVQKNVAEVRDKQSQGGNREGVLNQISIQSEVLEQTVESRGSHMSLMFFFLVAVIVVIGFMMYNRMQYYENKHFI